MYKTIELIENTLNRNLQHLFLSKILQSCTVKINNGNTTQKIEIRVLKMKVLAKIYGK